MEILDKKSQEFFDCLGNPTTLEELIIPTNDIDLYDLNINTTDTCSTADMCELTQAFLNEPVYEVEVNAGGPINYYDALIRATIGLKVNLYSKYSKINRLDLNKRHKLRQEIEKLLRQARTELSNEIGDLITKYGEEDK